MKKIKLRAFRYVWDIWLCWVNRLINWTVGDVCFASFGSKEYTWHQEDFYIKQYSRLANNPSEILISNTFSQSIIVIYVPRNFLLTNCTTPGDSCKRYITPSHLLSVLPAASLAGRKINFPRSNFAKWYRNWVANNRPPFLLFMGTFAPASAWLMSSTVSN